MRAPSRRDEWQDYVRSLAASAKPSPPFDGAQGHARRLLAFAHDFSRTGTSAGEGCWLTPDVEHRYTRRTAERYLSVLVDHTLVRRTSAPARGALGKPGRKARFGLVLPENVRHDSDGTWRTFAAQRLADVVRGPWSDQDPSEGGSLSTTSATVTHDRGEVSYSRPSERGAA